MTSLRRDQDDVGRRAFDAKVVRVGEWEGRPAVELEETWFYPEGGGQLADQGAIGPARVLDVQLAGDGTIWHVVDTPPPAGAWPAAIDPGRRLDHMQQHTGQHVLSAAFERLRGAETRSSTLGAERSVIEVALAAADWDLVREVQAAANAVVWEDREVRLHWTDDAGVGAFELRRPPKVSGRIRIVEIPGWDVSACGGTHVPRTGAIGAIVVTGWERVRGNVRFEFLCGGRALADHSWRIEALREAGRRRSVAEREVIAALERLADERTALLREREALRIARLEQTAHEAVGAAGRLADWAPERSRDDARRLAFAAIACGARWAAVGAGAPEPVLVVARPKSAGPDLREWLPELLALARGKGGGSAESITVAAADAEAARAAHARVIERLGAEAG